MSEQLKACPYCKGKRIISKPMHKTDRPWRVHCKRCGIAIIEKSKDLAEKLWNNRPTEDALREEIKELGFKVTDAESNLKVFKAISPEYRDLKAKVEELEGQLENINSMVGEPVPDKGYTTTGTIEE